MRDTENEDSSNPLEFKVALIFAMLFVVFTILTTIRWCMPVRVD